MEHRTLVGAAAGWAVLFGVDRLIDGKLFSVFSILFGIGFALQKRRAKARGHDTQPPGARRRSDEAGTLTTGSCRGELHSPARLRTLETSREDKR